jgi:hypothetical protein
MRTKAHLSARVRRGSGPCMSRAATRSSGNREHGARARQRQRPQLREGELAEGEIAGPEEGDAEQDAVGARVRDGARSPEKVRPCRDGADRAERH